MYFYIFGVPQEHSRYKIRASRYKIVIMETRVTLRRKHISGNTRESLFIDYYPAIKNPKTGKLTRREFLNSFLISEVVYEERFYTDKKGKERKTIVPSLTKNGQIKKRKLSSWDKLHNKETLERAEQIKLKRENEINKPLIYSDFEKEQLRLNAVAEGSFLDFFLAYTENRKGKDQQSCKIVHKHLVAFSKGRMCFRDLTEEFCDGFRNYLSALKAFKSERPIHPNSALKYWSLFKGAVKQAHKEKKIPINVTATIQNIKPVDSFRDFLTIEELNKLVKTECQDVLLKTAALFSCLTGLRKSDILKLTWGEIQTIDKKYAIRFRQQKTKGVETLWISEQAYTLLGKQGEPEEMVFPGLKINSYYQKYLELWLQAAGITKKISFHNMRHSFATLQLAGGTSIYTVSKMLGHKNIRTTEIYAKVVDKLKQDAADRIKLDL